ncbi:glycerol kinase [Corynebacterium kutscheri]|uniref:glycerol kinase GlpK n=1 Tax=Corynebacterium kutscheri TaxID=35755 RepID=UPI000F6B68E6|nr:glycerol kinase GlpK [Corynebacterium kutscheri]VEH81784.1 glycerol kinase [Corynebacterium kutscheri]
MRFVAAIDQGTTSTRCIIYDQQGKRIGIGQCEHRQIFPQKGWVEHDPEEIWRNTRRAVSEALANADLSPLDIAALGITNQRETTVVWDKKTGIPVYNAIVWQDTRTTDICTELIGDQGADQWLNKTGLLINSYPAGPKVTWILDNVAGARQRAENGELLFGTIDTWLLWNFTGGAHGNNGVPAVHATDVTNASRTLLMDLRTLQWDPELCAAMRIPMSMLPEIKPSVGLFGKVRSHSYLSDVEIHAILGDQQSALFGQGCFTPGDAKNTYGTGLFLLLNTGTEIRVSTHGLLTTVAYQIGNEKPVYALEGSVAVGGSLVHWLRDNLGMISSSAEIEELAEQVPDNGGVYIVPAFSGLFAPYWIPEARGAIVGLTRFANKNHFARAVLEATAFQTRELVDAMVADSQMPLTALRVDGGMTKNNLLMQFQADILGVPVQRSADVETTALGAAFAAGLSAGIYYDLSLTHFDSQGATTWLPTMKDEEIAAAMKEWKWAVQRTLDGEKE